MNIEELRDFCLSLGDVSEKTPFGNFARRYESILVFYVAGHMFCFVDMDNFTFVDIKSTPDEIDELKATHSSVDKPLNCSPRHWIQLNFNGDVPDSLIYSLINRAYLIVKQKYTKKR